MNATTTRLSEALADIVTGHGVKRAKHELVFNGKSVVENFVRSLEEHGFVKTTVGDIQVDVGERVPGFLIEGTTAYFGWVFWEKFTARKARKLWGSVVRNTKGDWAIQIPPTKSTPIYAHPGQKIEMDADKPLII
ncbi:MAG: hypothetical protein HYW57_10230 [Ignavibacteriales bacterium]|nr:hypothetical protein [Ignavibacteriales bacterium]